MLFLVNSLANHEMSIFKKKKTLGKSIAFTLFSYCCQLFRVSDNLLVSRLLYVVPANALKSVLKDIFRIILTYLSDKT